MSKLQLVLDDGITEDLGWHDAPALYRRVLADARGLRVLHDMRSSTAALVTGWAVRDMLATPMLLATSVRLPFEEARTATRFLFDVAYACNEHRIGGHLEVKE